MKAKYILSTEIEFITDLVAQSAPADRVFYARLLNENPTSDDYTKQFRRDDNNHPVLTSYSWLGYLKRQCRTVNRIVKEIDHFVYIEDRYVTIESDHQPDIVTFKGVRAEVIPAGCKCRITFASYNKSAIDVVKTALNRGRTIGFGNIYDIAEGYGKFSWKCLSLKCVQDDTSTEMMRNQYTDYIDLITYQYDDKLYELQQVACKAENAAITVIKSCDMAIAAKDEKLARELIGNEAFSGDVWNALETIRANASEIAQKWAIRMRAMTDLGGGSK